MNYRLFKAELLKCVVAIQCLIVTIKRMKVVMAEREQDQA